MLIAVIVLLPALLCGVLALGRYEELLLGSSADEVPELRLGSSADDLPSPPAAARPAEVAPVAARPARHRASGRHSRHGARPARLGA
ncbi:hypothetical protein OG906_02545 [Streptomyces sp. NBC_01426]|uniref:hypothetical protein n=1 Tax=Streptomyces sp. NBC_01426 TaxID=2975866 RepID=UPI002E2ECC51|nr:hypothetical protein [Streptomyces sp. NBC_01426]